MIQPKKVPATSLSVRMSVKVIALLWVLLGQAGLATILAPQPAVAASPFPPLRIKPINTRGETRDLADKLVIRGLQLHQEGDWQGAIATWTQAKDLYKAIDDHAAMGLTYQYLGLAYANQGRLEMARDAFSRRLAVAYDNQDKQGQISGLNNMGTILLAQDKPYAAALAFRDALVIASQIESLEGGGLSLNNLGLASAVAGNYEQAAQFYEASLILRIQVDDPIARANTFNNLGDAYQALGRYADTIAAYGTALQYAEETGSDSTLFRAIDGLVASHTPKGRYSRAFDLLNERLTVAQKERNLPQQLLTLKTLGTLSLQTQNPSAARGYYVQALTVARSMNDSSTESELLGELRLLDNGFVNVQ